MNRCARPRRGVGRMGLARLFRQVNLLEFWKQNEQVAFGQTGADGLVKNHGAASRRPQDREASVPTQLFVEVKNVPLLAGFGVSY